MAIATGLAILGGSAIAAGATVYGASKSAHAADQAGAAQAKAAQDQLDFQKKVYDDNKAQMQSFMADAAKYSQPTVSDVNALQKMVSISDAQTKSALNSITSAQQVLDSVNPALKSAGDQALQLIKGQSAEILKPIQDSRDRQKTELQNQLAQRFGASWRFSAAGIKAMNDFDNQTSETMYNAHMGAINTVVNAASGLSSISAQVQASANNQVQTAVGANQSVISGNDALTKRELSPFYIGAQFQPNAGGVGAAGQQVVGSIGNQFAGGIAMGQGIQNAGAAVGQGALTYALANSGFYNQPSVKPATPATPAPTVGFPVPNLSGSTLPTVPQFNIGDLSK